MKQDDLAFDHHSLDKPPGEQGPNALGQYLTSAPPKVKVDYRSSPELEPMATTAPVGRISPMDVLHHRFPTVWRGYGKEEVHDFLADVSQQMEYAQEDRNRLTQQIAELHQQIQTYRNNEDELRRTVVAAERISHELREQSKREANSILQEAERKALSLSEQTASREREALLTHDARMAELEATFNIRRTTLEQQYQQQEHELEARARERSAQLEREFSARYAEVTGRLTSAHAEYANFMAQYRAVSQAFAQAANTQLLPENPALLSPESMAALHTPLIHTHPATHTIESDVTAVHATEANTTAATGHSGLLVEEQRFE